MARGRLQSVDVYRGLALVAMAAYHTAWDLNFNGLIEIGIGVDPLIISIQRGILTAFLLLSGASLTLAHGAGIRWRGFWKREAMLIGAAVLVSVGTWFAFGDELAYFGVLHALALFALAGLALVTAPLWIGVIVAAIFLAAPLLYTSDLFDPQWLNWIGFFKTTPATADLVPVFPWFGVYIIGMLGMRYLKARPVFIWSSGAWPVRALAVFGRWSLLFYLVHQPALFEGISQLAAWRNSAQTLKFESFSRECSASCMAGPGKAESAGALQFCTNYCHCALDMTVRDNLWSATPTQLKSMSGLCTAMSE